MYKVLLTASWIVFFPTYAYAYLDPGSGSFLIQALIAALVGISVGIKLFWHNIKDFFVRIFSKSS